MSSSVGVAWQASKSQVIGTPSAVVQLNTPRILELDVNRMMIGQTDVRYVYDHFYLNIQGILNSFVFSRKTFQKKTPLGRKPQA